MNPSVRKNHGSVINNYSRLFQEKNLLIEKTGNPPLPKKNIMTEVCKKLPQGLHKEDGLILQSISYDALHSSITQILPSIDPRLVSQTAW